MSSVAGTITLEIAEQAMFWYLELLEPQVSEDTRLACHDWRRAHPLHEQAWQRAQNLGQRMGEVRQQRSLASATLTAAGRARRRAAKQLAILLLAGAGAWSLRQSGLVQPLLADHRSGVGQRRSVELVDGTRIQLNTDTAIDIAADRESRRIDLLRGEILVTLGQDPQARRLRIETAQGAVSALHGRISVRQREDYTQVALLQGEARVEPRNGPPRMLAVAERVNFTDREIFSRRGTDADLAWTEGMIVADGQRLADFLVELSRYRPGHLGCDPALAELRVSGTYPLDDTDRVLAAVSRTLQVEMRSITRYWVTLKPSAMRG